MQNNSNTFELIDQVIVSTLMWIEAASIAALTRGVVLSGPTKKRESLFADKGRHSHKRSPNVASRPEGTHSLLFVLLWLWEKLSR